MQAGRGHEFRDPLCARSLIPSKHVESKSAQHRICTYPERPKRLKAFRKYRILGPCAMEVGMKLTPDRRVKDHVARSVTR